MVVRLGCVGAIALLQMASLLVGAEPAMSPVVGPAVSQLGRPLETDTRQLTYAAEQPQSSATTSQQQTPADAASPGTLQETTTPPLTSPEAETGSTTNPQETSTTQPPASNSSPAASTTTKKSRWSSMQAAFRPFSSSDRAEQTPTPAADRSTVASAQIDLPDSQAPMATAPSIATPSTSEPSTTTLPGTSSVVTTPSTTSPMPPTFMGIEPPVMMPFGPLGLGGGCGYCNSGCGGNCSQGGCGGAGSPFAAGAQAGCGCGRGCAPGTCKGGCASGSCGTGDCGPTGCGPNGCGGPRVRQTPDSCYLQRLACCITEPYPDCSNGCVDFCHSFIFHEDCCWLFSNHKCPAPWCGPYPHGGCSNPNGCGCGCTECIPAPDVYFTADALVLYRNNQAFDQTVVELTGVGTSLLDTDNFGFGWAAGPRFTLGYRPTGMDAWELSYFGLQDWNSRRTVLGAADLSLPGDLGLDPALNFSSADSFDVSYSSTMHNAELNYFWQHRYVTWLIGFRYFQWSEDFDITSVAATGSSEYDISTRNHLCGGQLGLRLRGGWRRLNWDFIGKAGPYGNASKMQQSVGNVGDSLVRDTSAAAGYWAFVGELGVNLNYYVYKGWSVRGGYNLLWAEGLALAPDQLDFSNTSTSGTALQDSGGVFLHGAHLGLGCRW